MGCGPLAHRRRQRALRAAEQAKPVEPAATPAAAPVEPAKTQAAPARDARPQHRR